MVIMIRRSSCSCSCSIAQPCLCFLCLFRSFYGALLLIQCRSAQVPNISWLFFAGWLLDIIETGLFNYATRQFPERVGSTLIGVASIANEVKWISVGCGFISVLGLFVYNSLIKRAKSHQQ